MWMVKGLGMKREIRNMLGQSRTDGEKAAKKRSHATLGSAAPKLCTELSWRGITVML